MPILDTNLEDKTAEEKKKAALKTEASKIVGDVKNFLTTAPAPAATVKPEYQLNPKEPMPVQPPLPMVPAAAQQQFATMTPPQDVTGGSEAPALYTPPPMAMQTETSITKVPGVPQDPALVKRQAEMDKQQQTLLQEAANIGAQKAAEETAYKQQLVKEQQQAAIDMQAAEAKRQEQIQKKQDEVQFEIEAAKNMKIDPDRRGLGAKIAGAIAIGLGTYASVMGGGPNYALQIINKQIDDDIAAQKEEIANNWRNVDAKRNELSDLTQKFGDQRIAENVLRAQKNLALAADLDARVAKFAEGTAKNNGQQLALAAQQQAQDRLVQAKKDAADKIQTTTKLTTAPVTKNYEQADSLRKEYNSDPMVVEARKDLKNAKNMDQLLAAAKKGDQGAANSLIFMIAKANAGVGVMSDQDFIKSSPNRDLIEKAKSAVTAMTSGQLTENELKSYRNTIDLRYKTAEDTIKQKGKAILDLGMRRGVNPTDVLIDPEELNIVQSKSQFQKDQEKARAIKARQAK